MRFFAPPIGQSTFYNLVNEGVIVKLDGVRGRYRLNESLVRLGLPPARELPPSPDAARRERELLDLALHLAAPDVAFAPPGGLSGRELSEHEKSHVALLTLHHHREMAGLADRDQRKSYIQGILDAAAMLRDVTPNSPGPA